jgi:exodeoxyribonuclease V alpha subunit
MSHEEHIVGTIERLLFQNTETGYSVFVITLSNTTTTITATGNFPQLNQGQEVKLHGNWTTHPKFGRQFAAQQCMTVTPTSIHGLKKFLGSGMIKGIGKVYAEKLVDYFGSKVLDVIDTTPERMQEVPGIAQKRIEQITTAWQQHKNIADIMVFLQDKGISPAYAAKIYKQYKQQAIAVLQENPYRLADEVWGIGFKMADTIAQAMGFALDGTERIAAGILFAIKQASGQGHLYVELEELKNTSFSLLGLEPTQYTEKIKKAFLDLYKAEKIKLIAQGEAQFVTLTSFYFCERGVAERLKQLNNHTASHAFNSDAVYQALRASSSIELSEQQQKGILCCLQNKITIITGGPGTGKTTLIKELLTFLEQEKVPFKLAAPTGRAAKRMTEGTGRYAMTIHRLLEFDVSTMRFTHNEHNALKTDFLIIDEASMIDIFLGHAILKALSLPTRLLLIGDIDQLPAVGAGNFLHDIIASGLIPTVTLKTIFRQATNSLIVLNAHRVNEGEFPLTHAPEARQDFIFIKEDDPAAVITHLKRILFASLPRHGISASQAVVLVPMNRGIVGTHVLNQQLQEILNPTAAPGITHYTTLFKQGDKVMQIRNNYDKNVFNGDIGYIEDLDHEERTITVQYGERLVIYESDEFDELVLAYAMTIHKSQGSEYPAVIIPLFMQHFTLLQRNLLYTAITRAKKFCILIGQPKAIGMALATTKGNQRTTFLKVFLQENQLTSSRHLVTHDT